jgi:hypothetical protein
MQGERYREEVQRRGHADVLATSASPPPPAVFALAGIVCCLQATCQVLRCCCQWDSRPTTAGSTSQRSLGAWFKESVDFFSKWFLSIAWDSDEAVFTQLYTVCSHRQVLCSRCQGFPHQPAGGRHKHAGQAVGVH